MTKPDPSPSLAEQVKDAYMADEGTAEAPAAAETPAPVAETDRKSVV